MAACPTWDPSRASVFCPLRAVTLVIGVPPRTWHSGGAVLVLYSLRDVPWAITLFEIRIFQLLGRYSFSMYLKHVWIAASAGPFFFLSWMWAITGYEHVFSSAVGFVMAHSSLFAGVLLSSIVFRTLVLLPLNKPVDCL